MNRNLRMIVALGLGLPLGHASAAEEPAAGSRPAPIPLTREDMKKALEESKRSVPRLPLPPPTEAEKAKAAQAKNDPVARTRGLGVGIVNNGRMRSYYLSDYSAGLKGGQFGLGGFSVGAPASRAGGARPADAGPSLGNEFPTMMFWIVSRGNNCTYCMGHQESKLAAAGLTDDQIAALDGDWSEFDEPKRAAFAFTKKLSFEPQSITDADIAALRKHYDDARIIEIISAVAGFNSMNRWTGPLRITQEDRHVFLKPTSKHYAARLTRIAPVQEGLRDPGFAPPATHRRPALESPAEVEAALDRARKRSSRLRLADESATRELLNGTLDEAAPAEWMRLLAVVPSSAAGRVAATFAAEQKGTLEPRTKAIIAWVAARNDRAWYALGHARKRLRALGFTDDQAFALDRPEALSSAADREVVQYAAKITVNPALADDEDIARLRAHFNDKKVAEIVFQVTQAAYFDRLTEAAGLRLED